MYRVSSFILHFARALLAGSLVATLWVNLDPASYYDVMEHGLFPLPFPGWIVADHVRATLITLTSDLLMAFFFFLLGKELWEANMLERGALHGRRGALPFMATMGAVGGAVLVWLLVSALIETAEEASFGSGWAVPVGCDVVIGYAIGRRLFGPQHPALHMLLLITIGAELAGLLALALMRPDEALRLLWLLLPLAAAAGVWLLYGRHARSERETERQRALHLWPYVVAGALSWTGVAAAGLPGALGLLPVIPAIPHARRAFGLFAEAEEFLHDPLNRFAHLLMRPLVGVLFLFGLTRGGIDLGAFAPTTLVTLAAFWIGKPLGLMAGTLIALRLFGLPLPQGLTLADMARIGAIAGIGFTVPVLSLDTAIPGGAMAEAARLGLALTLLAGPLLLLLSRARPSR
ncbi:MULTISPECIES: Na+/H+ antiporter NhaA [Gemmobacter]|jgi:NhaA family Na+:H+ antiporter|uniref:Putative Na(+)/H(+) antiporter NhaA homolog n=1 Tax=Gemmobacter nanjingensis TaxID=488454 RepID=A0ABQ3FBC3_9RHOB|nr:MULTISPECIES: Na+/H+ antiporter NhaA [Gemmobacter]OJY27141.1 MAG: hypothetical protein BGP11_13635 [Rhodobacterales bacterium 65-51]GHC16995.1 Na+/H+ antiporter NhaA [Gemmobacter nanjingensis]